MKEQKKGISLIVLIIIIIVMIILSSAVIISLSNSGIIDYAEDATKTYITKQNEENQIVQDYLDLITDKTTAHDVIAEIILGAVTGTMEESVVIQRLKEEGAIEQDVVNWMDGATNVPFADATALGIYFYKINALYKVQLIGEETKIVYVEENDFANEYKIGKNAKLTKEILERSIENIDTNTINNLASDDELIDLIIESSSNRIKNIDNYAWSSEKLRLDNVTIVDNDGNEIVFGYDMGYKILLEFNNHTVSITYGT